MKSVVLSALMLILLTACATAPKPAPVLEACPRIPPLVLPDAPERDWLGQMQLFLQGSLPTQPGLRLPSTPASPPTGP